MRCMHIFPGASAALTLRFVACFGALCLLPRLASLSVVSFPFFFSFIFLFIFSLQHPCRTFPLARSTPFVSGLSGLLLFGGFQLRFDIGAHRIGTPSPSANDTREHITPPPCQGHFNGPFYHMKRRLGGISKSPKIQNYKID